MLMRCHSEPVFIKSLAIVGERAKNLASIDNIMISAGDSSVSEEKHLASLRMTICYYCEFESTESPSR